MLSIFRFFLSVTSNRRCSYCPSAITTEESQSRERELLACGCTIFTLLSPWNLNFNYSFYCSLNEMWKSLPLNVFFCHSFLLAHLIFPPTGRESSFLFFLHPKPVHSCRALHTSSSLFHRSLLSFFYYPLNLLTYRKAWFLLCFCSDKFSFI